MCIRIRYHKYIYIFIQCISTFNTKPNSLSLSIYIYIWAPCICIDSIDIICVPCNHKTPAFWPLFSGPPNVFDQPKRQDLSAAELVGNVDVGGFSGEEWINECWRPPQSDLPSLNLTCSLKNVGWKMSFPFGMAYFQVRTVSFREGNRI